VLKKELDKGAYMIIFHEHGNADKFRSALRSAEKTIGEEKGKIISISHSVSEVNGNPYFSAIIQWSVREGE
jgi:hypothetical protein